MRRSFSAFLTLCLAWAVSLAPAQAYFLSKDLTPDTVQPISVYVLDFSSDECWTNASEMKGPIENGLRQKGYDVREEALQRLDWYFLFVIVAARKEPSMLPEHCFGIIGMSVTYPDYSQEISSNVDLFLKQESFLIEKNVDSYVLEQVEVMLELLPSR